MNVYIHLTIVHHYILVSFFKYFLCRAVQTAQLENMTSELELVAVKQVLSVLRVQKLIYYRWLKLEYMKTEMVEIGLVCSHVLQSMESFLNKKQKIHSSYPNYCMQNESTRIIGKCSSANLT